MLLVKQPAFLADQTWSSAGIHALHGIVDSGRNGDLRWPDFTPYKTEIAKLYEMNTYSPVWVLAEACVRKASP